MPSCKHEDFKATVEVTRLFESKDRLDDPHGFTADVRVECADCGKPFGFKGMEAGVSPDAPMRSIDALEARMPLMSPAELALLGPFPAAAVRLPAPVVAALEDLTAALPKLRCQHAVTYGHRENANRFKLEEVIGDYAPGDRVVVVDPGGWRLLGVVTDHDPAGTLWIEAKTAWRPG